MPDPYDLLPSVPALRLASDDIEDGRPLLLDQVHASIGGAGRSPQLAWSGSPAGTRSHAVTCFDPDAATGSGFWHWLLVGLPAGDGALPAGAGSGVQRPGAFHLRNDFGLAEYGGAVPPAGDGPHRLLFAVHALGTDDLGVDEAASAGALGLALVEHTLARGVLRPTFGHRTGPPKATTRDA